MNLFAIVQLDTNSNFSSSASMSLAPCWLLGKIEEDKRWKK